jgi:thiamine kinase-like enzyme
MENVPAGTVDMRQVAAHLGEWNSTSAIPRVDWLTRDQLAQRIDGTDLDWKSVNGDRRAVTIWEARHELLERLATFPRELSHGDVNPNNVFESRGNTVVVDWQAFGIAPAGADLAALTLQTREDLLPDYLGALDKHCSRETAEYAYRATLALLGASQYHWFLVRGEPPDDGYLDFVWENRPLLKR